MFLQWEIFFVLGAHAIKKSIHMVIDEIKIEEGDTICSVSEFYAMSKNFPLVSYAHLLQVLKFMFMYCHYFLNLTVF